MFLFNTLTKKKEIFEPQDKNEVSLYSCGPTVYQKQHLGNLRPYAFVDVLKRSLKQEGYEVNHVINITDVGHLVSDADTGEDKMEKSVKEQRRSAQEIADEYTNLFLNDLRLLNVSVDRDSVTLTKATQFIQEQIDLIKTLEDKGFTYKTSDGVYFDTSKFPEYGKLGNIDTKNLEEGARTEKNPEKRGPTDFALWKLSKPGEKREQEWESPWGTGFPGWHIECSAMSMNKLGETIDIHTGGIDHIPTHHNNEIAQSESATGKQFVRFWLHNAFITIDDQKVSKSIGNVVFLSDVISKDLHPISYKYWLLTAHYRSPINFTWEALEGANNAYVKLLNHFHNAEDKGMNEEFRNTFKKAMRDDLNTPEAISLLWQYDLSKEDFLYADEFLGFDMKNQSNELFNVPEEIRDLAEKREGARREKDFDTADNLRKEIEEAGYVINDTESGPIVMRK